MSSIEKVHNMLFLGHIENAQLNFVDLMNLIQKKMKFCDVELGLLLDV